MQTRGLAASFEGLNSSVAQSAGKLWCCKVTVKKWLMLVLEVKTTWSLKVFIDYVVVKIEVKWFWVWKLFRRHIVKALISLQI